eukprot:scaffold5108_cov172-Amphora_coffeaeformis.AAC.27
MHHGCEKMLEYLKPLGKDDAIGEDTISCIRSPHKRLVMEKRWVWQCRGASGVLSLLLGVSCKTMGTIAEGVEFDTIAREVRCKWSEDNDKASLVKAQAELTKILGDLKAVDGVKSVQRVVCGT